MKKTKQEKYQLFSVDSVNQFNKGLFSINSEEFITFIENDSVNFKLLVFFTNWCPGSKEFLPGFVNDLQNSDVPILPFFISPDDWVYKYDYMRYAENLNLKGNAYLLDVYAYGEKRSPHYRMGKFISEICDDCSEIGGFPSFILFDKQNEIIFKKTGATPMDTLLRYVNEAENR